MNKAEFWKNVKKTRHCWIWTRASTGFGYGKLQFYNRDVMAHRLSFELKHGKIKKGVQVLHKCDVPACVRPSHLFPGNHQANLRDAHNKGRGPNQKLTVEQVKRIRKMYKPYIVRRDFLARKFGVSVHAIAHIVQRQQWKWI